MVVHYRKTSYEKSRIPGARTIRNIIPCNVWPPDVETSQEKDDVTCGNCMRTKVFKDA